MDEFHLHLVSDATGETVQSVARACLVQFDGPKPVEHIWTLVRNDRQIEEVINSVQLNGGLVLFTLVDPEIGKKLQSACIKLGIPCISVLQPTMLALTSYLKTKGLAKPGRQHVLDSEYYERITALDYAMTHDDGQGVSNMEEADVILVGVSRTSKTPTCIYLANKGIKAANIPIVLGVDLPEELLMAKDPLIVGLTNDVKNLAQIRRNRLNSLNEQNQTKYIDPESIAEEILFARRLFTEKKWPVIDISRRSIEETAAAISKLLKKR